MEFKKSVNQTNYFIISIKYLIFNLFNLCVKIQKSNKNQNIVKTNIVNNSKNSHKLKITPWPSKSLISLLTSNQYPLFYIQYDTGFWIDTFGLTTFFVRIISILLLFFFFNVYNITTFNLNKIHRQNYFIFDNTEINMNLKKMNHPILISSYMNIYNYLPRIPHFDPLEKYCGLLLRYDSDVSIKRDWKSRRILLYEQVNDSELKIFISLRGTLFNDFRQLIYDISTSLVEFKNVNINNKVRNIIVFLTILFQNNDSDIGMSDEVRESIITYFIEELSKNNNNDPFNSSDWENKMNNLFDKSNKDHRCINENLKDIFLSKSMLPLYNILVHAGFYESYLHDDNNTNNNSSSPICIIQNTCQRVINSYLNRKNNNIKSYRIILTGYSLGGSTSLIAGVILAINLFLKNGILLKKNNQNDNQEIIKLFIDVYVFGALNVGNNEFYLLTKLLESICELSIYTIINNNDIMVRFPLISNIKNADYFSYFYENINLENCVNIQKGYKFNSNNFSFLNPFQMFKDHYSLTYFEKIYNNYQDIVNLMNEYQIIKKNNKNKQILFGYPSQQKFKFC